MELGLAIPLVFAVPLLGAVACFIAPRYQRLFSAATVVLLALPVGQCLVALLKGHAVVYQAGGWAAPLGI